MLQSNSFWKLFDLIGDDFLVTSKVENGMKTVIFTVLEANRISCCGTHWRYVLVADDGESWEVERDTIDPFQPRWHRGEEIDVEVRVVSTTNGGRVLAPIWVTVGAHQSREYDRHRNDGDGHLGAG